MEILVTFRERRYTGVAELAQAAAAVLAAAGGTQGKRTVTEIPDERTIRYYLSENLLPPPAGREGTASVFVYEHLLALIAVKKLQSENLPIRKIRDLIGGKSIAELERIVGVAEEPAGDKNEAQEYLESLLFQKSPPRPPASPSFARPPQPVKPAAPLPPDKLSAKMPAARPRIGKWKRFEIARGLELHLEENFRMPSDSGGLRLLIQMIEEIIASESPKS